MTLLQYLNTYSHGVVIYYHSNHFHKPQNVFGLLVHNTRLLMILDIDIGNNGNVRMTIDSHKCYPHLHIQKTYRSHPALNMYHPMSQRLDTQGFVCVYIRCLTCLSTPTHFEMSHSPDTYLTLFPTHPTHSCLSFSGAFERFVQIGLSDMKAYGFLTSHHYRYNCLKPPAMLSTCLKDMNVFFLP